MSDTKILGSRSDTNEVFFYVGAEAVANGPMRDEVYPMPKKVFKLECKVCDFESDGFTKLDKDINVAAIGRFPSGERPENAERSYRITAVEIIFGSRQAISYFFERGLHQGATI